MIEEIGQEVLKEAYPGIKKKLEKQVERTFHNLKAKVANACHNYEKNYRERHGQFKVFCVEMREPIALDEIYVTVQFLDCRMGSKYKSVEDIELAFRERYGMHSFSSSNEKQEGIQVANNKQYLMLLGSPGVGKSTFLRKVGIEALKGKDGDFEHKCIPVLLELKRFTEGQIDIEGLIAKEFAICGYPYPKEMAETALKSGKLLILFDGLDEVPTANVDNVVNKLGDFVDRYNRNRFIASCRIAAYKGGFKRFSEVEIASFDDSQVESYINNWFASTPDRYRRQLDEDMKTAEKCWKSLNAPEHQSTKELAQNPLLLTLLCMVYDSSQDFPRNRVDLYEKALNILLEEWAAEKRVRRDTWVSEHLDIATEKRMLSEIAAKNFEIDRLFFKKDEITQQIDEFGKANANTPSTFNAHKILETILIDQGIFVERVKNFYSFSHLTFQEYLTANYIVGDTRSIQELVTCHLHDFRWQEVFLLTAGKMREADRLLERMTNRTSKLTKTDGLKRLFQWAKRITNTSNDLNKVFRQRMYAVRKFLSLWILNNIYQESQNFIQRYSELILYKSISNPDSDFISKLNKDFILKYDSELDWNVNFEFDQDLDFFSYSYLDPRFKNNSRIDDVRFYLDLWKDKKQDFSMYKELAFNIGFHLCFPLDYYLVLTLYQDLYRYVDTDFYHRIPFGYLDMFVKELDNRIEFVKTLEQEKIFKGVDLQKIVQRFIVQKKYIKSVGKGKTVKPPQVSIYDTWLSVLHITDDMFAISYQEIQNYIYYIRAIQLIFECKEVAGRVSPEIWQKLEDKLLAWK